MTSKFGVSEAKEEALRQRMVELGIREEDLKERFLKPRGPGGRKASSSATCVYLKHLPTGIEVKVQRERSQAINRFLARRLLVEKIEERLLGRQSGRQQRYAKIRRQKLKRYKRAKRKCQD